MSSLELEQQREEAIRKLVAQLPDEQRRYYYSQMRKKVKDPDSYAVLNYLFLAGLHHFYLGKWLRGTVNLIVFSVGVLLVILQLTLPGWTLILIVTAVELPALFRAQYRVLKHNNDLSDAILDKFKT